MTISVQLSDRCVPGELTTKLQNGTSLINQELEQAKGTEDCLVVIRGSCQGYRYFLHKKAMSIGRDATVDICLQDASVSRHHARISKKHDGSVVLEDMHSCNGTQVNGRTINAGDRMVLAKEDVISIGNTIFKFLPAGELEIVLYGRLGDAICTDSLTKIYNKGYLFERLSVQFRRARALSKTFSLLFFDIDYFKRVNDTYGHSAGDYVLQELAQVVRKTSSRKDGLFARYGGEEFVLVFDGVDESQAVAKAETIRAAIAHHSFVYEGQILPITVSIGVAELCQHCATFRDVLKKADEALYTAKRLGRNRVVKKQR